MSKTCASCGTSIAGRFCTGCGALVEPGACGACQAALSSGARFCHRCGAAAQAGGGGGRARNAWIVAGVVVGLAALFGVWKLGGAGPTVPDMGNAGNVRASGGVAPISGRAPDISNMTPRQQFDRLFERILTAAEAGDSATVLRFAPMGLGAFAQLDSVNLDARYHVAMIHLAIGDFGAARAQADTILNRAPGHLFGYMVRGEAADRQNQAEALNRAYRDFLDHFDSELRAGRIEYAEHRPSLDDFRTRARASLGP